MRTFFKWATATLCLHALAACGGNVVVDSPNGGNTTTITTSSGATGTGAVTSGCGAGSCGCGAGSCGASGAGASTGGGAFPGGGGDVTSTSSSSSGGTTGCSCDGWLAGGTVVCGGAPLTAKMDLQACACGGSACLTSCASNLCANEPIAGSCTMCVLEKCASQFTNCEQN